MGQVPFQQAEQLYVAQGPPADGGCRQALPVYASVAVRL